MPFAYSTESVSYTHLDVYKRQAEGLKHSAEGQVNAAVLVLGGSVDRHFGGHVVFGHFDGGSANGNLNGCLLYTSRCV